MSERYDPVRGSCGRALDTAGDVCPFCFHIHRPVKVTPPEPVAQPVSYRDLAGKPRTFSCRGCNKPASYTSDDELSHEDLDDALACRFDGLTPEEIQSLEDKITCTCGLTFPDQAGFDGHQDQVIQDQGTISGHWEVGTV
jgi:hypothetical protein